ncbi:hypothetical protein [Bradyrhizobium sp. Ash2021]|uniref:hypothetical protein n=1 Tax=Bradyrhizobium sp. Ash2021 TaxID=2954771 RepID=UPI002815C634|nr:hypothetical protein [Bradyrhizobium sp. Ash2021]WMT78195.1 hypothetical protein NL528_18415 [Bradyrhizobium sp. Ash2021]
MSLLLAFGVLLDRFSSGSVYRETELERTELETIVSEFMTGQFNDPVRVIAFQHLRALGGRRFQRNRARNPDTLRYRR